MEVIATKMKCKSGEGNSDTSAIWRDIDTHGTIQTMKHYAVTSEACPKYRPPPYIPRPVHLPPPGVFPPFWSYCQFVPSNSDNDAHAIKVTGDPLWPD